MPTILNNGIQLPDKGSVDWYSSMQSNYNLIDTHLGDTDAHVTAEDRANWNSKQGSLSQAQLDAIAQVATNTDDIATLQSGKANTSHTHSSSDISDIGDYATKQYVDTSISGLVDNAPDALNTLNELSAALNDDSNFASTITTALGAKANSADLATVATSGSYTDLTDKPTINDSTITIQKNGSTVDTFTTNGSAKTINIPVPTKTSDITNDSNFVDTSNSAVSSGITSAKVTSYDAHIADTDKHVTSSDKTTWNTVTSKANDSDVVHKNGDESVIGSKRFGVVQSFTGYPSIRLYSTNDDINVLPTYVQQQDIRFTDKNNNIIAYFIFQHRTDANEPFRTCWRQIKFDGTSGYYSVNFNNLGEFYPESNNAINLGTPTCRWKGVYAVNYYYGTTEWGLDKANVWTGTNNFQQNITYEKTNFYHQVANPSYILKDIELEKGSLATTHASYPGLWQDKNSNILGYIRFVEYSSGRQTAELRVSNLIKNGALDPTGAEVNCGVQLELQPSGEKSLIPETNNNINLGTSTNKWKTFNGVEPSSLSLPSGNASDVIDISSYITDLSGNINNYTAPANGWISITMNNCSGIQTYIAGFWGHQVIRPSAGDVRFLMPILKNLTASIFIFGGTIDNARFIPCQGNV